MGMCCKKKRMIGCRNVLSMKWGVPDQEVDERGLREGLCKKTVKHINRTRRLLWIVIDGEK